MKVMGASRNIRIPINLFKVFGLCILFILKETAIYIVKYANNMYDIIINAKIVIIIISFYNSILMLHLHYQSGR
jgi:hypothetical protein